MQIMVRYELPRLNYQVIEEAVNECPSHFFVFSIARIL